MFFEEEIAVLPSDRLEELNGGSRLDEYPSLHLGFIVFSTGERPPGHAPSNTVESNSLGLIDHDGADCNVEACTLNAVTRRDEANCPAVHPSRRSFHLSNDLHSSSLRCSRHRTAGEECLKNLWEAHLGLERGGDLRDHLPDTPILLDNEQFVNRDRPELCNAPKIVPHEIDDHHVLSAFLLRGSKALAQRFVLFNPPPPWSSALHGPRCNAAVPDREESLRRDRENVNVSVMEVSSVSGTLCCKEM